MRVHVGGVPVLLEGPPADLLDLRKALGAAVDTDEAPLLTLRLRRGGVPPPQRPADRQVDHVRYWDERGATVVAAGAGRTARVRQGEADLDPADGGVRAVHALLLPVLAELFGQQGACLVHAAAFVDGPVAVLVLGGSGQGKSTLAVAALTLGWPVASDDLVVLRRVDGGLTMSGVPQPLALPADVPALGVLGGDIPGDPRGRRAAAGPAPMGRRVDPLGAVLLVEHSHLERGHLRPAAASAVVAGVLAGTMEGGSPETVQQAFPFAVAAARVPAWHVGHAADPQVRVAAAAERLAQVSRARAPVG